MQALLLALIRFYKRFVSPHKGYGCAYRVHTGHASCSTLGYRAIRRRGAWAGLALLRQRCHRCGVAQRRYGTRVRPLAAQRGDCDPGCDGDCDGPDLDCDFRRVGGSWCCDFFDFFDCCDGPDRQRRKPRKRQDKDVHLPPRRPRQDWPDDAKR